MFARLRNPLFLSCSLRDQEKIGNMENTARAQVRYTFPSSPRIHSEGPQHCIASWTNILMVMISGEITLDLLQASVAAHRVIHAEYPSGIGVIALVHGTPPVPSTEARRMSSEHIRSTAGEVLAQASLIEAEGFWASAMRSAITTINLLARAPNPTKVFGTRKDAVDWLNQYMEIGDGAGWDAGLSGAIEQVLARGRTSELRA